MLIVAVKIMGDVDLADRDVHEAERAIANQNVTLRSYPYMHTSGCLSLFNRPQKITRGDGNFPLLLSFRNEQIKLIHELELTSAVSNSLNFATLFKIFLFAPRIRSTQFMTTKLQNRRNLKRPKDPNTKL